MPFHCYSLCWNACITAFGICDKENISIVRSAIWKCLQNVQMGISSVWWKNVSKKIEAIWIQHKRIWRVSDQAQTCCKSIYFFSTTLLAPDHKPHLRKPFTLLRLTFSLSVLLDEKSNGEPYVIRRRVRLGFCRTLTVCLSHEYDIPLGTIFEHS